MKIRVTTVSGSFYDIDLDRMSFERNRDGNEVAIVEWRSGNPHDRHLVPVAEWDEITWPEIGQSMYIRGEGIANWYLTTPVVDIDEFVDGMTMTSHIPVVKR